MKKTAFTIYIVTSISREEQLRLHEFFLNEKSERKPLLVHKFRALDWIVLYVQEVVTNFV